MIARSLSRSVFARSTVRPTPHRRARLAVEALDDRCVPATLTVNGTNDDTAADSTLTLREAVLLVNNGGNAPAALGRSLSSGEAGQVSGAYGNNDTIRFADYLTGQTITLGGTTLNVLKSVSVVGNVPGLALSGNDLSHVFDVGDGGSSTPILNIDGLTITHGFGQTSGNARLGGGIFVNTGSTLNVTNSLFANNSDPNEGGGGIYSFNGTLTVANTTFANNLAKEGSAIKSFGNARVTVSNCTCVGNSAFTDHVGTILNMGSTAVVNNTVLYGNSPDDFSDVSGSLVGDYDLTGDGTAPGANSLRFFNPLLAPLGSYGGPTQSFGLLPGSPALNAGDPAAGGLDQRGRPVAGGRRDIGAFESQGFNLTTTGGGQATVVGTAFANPLTLTVSAVDPNLSVAGGVVTFAAPGSGAGAGLGSPAVGLGANGVASTTVTANGSAGAYAVTASLGNNLTTSFGLINLPANTAPTLSNVPGAVSVARGSTLGFTAAAGDPDLVNGVGQTLTFSLVNPPAGAFIDPQTGAFNWTPANDLPLGDYSFAVRVTDSGTPALSDTQPITVTVTGNTPPTLTLVPTLVTVNELTQLAFTPQATDPDGGQTLTFSLAGAPAGAAIDPNTGSFTWTPTEAQGPATYQFAVAVTDGTATVSQPVTVLVNEVNATPTLANVPGSLTTAPGSPVAFTATATDPDLINGFGNTLTFSLVGAPAGASIDPDTGAFSWAPGDTTLPGNYTFKVRVADGGSPGLSDTKSITVGVKPAALVNGDLLVGGTAGNDSIAVNPSKDGKSLVVTINKAVVGTFPASGVTGKIVVHGLSGNDNISVSSKVTKAAWLFGEGGNDVLTGGGGNNLLVGGDGNDTLSAKAGTNVLIGGAGADKLAGGAGADLLIAGPTAFDADPIGLGNIFAEWTSTDTYATKVVALTGGVNGTALTAATVSDDGVKDAVSGGKGIDWLIVSASDAVSKPDAGETVTKV